MIFNQQISFLYLNFIGLLQCSKILSIQGLGKDHSSKETSPVYGNCSGPLCSHFAKYSSLLIQCSLSVIPFLCSHLHLLSISSCLSLSSTPCTLQPPLFLFSLPPPPPPQPLLPPLLSPFLQLHFSYPSPLCHPLFLIPLLFSLPSPPPPLSLLSFWSVKGTNWRNTCWSVVNTNPSTQLHNYLINTIPYLLFNIKGKVAWTRTLPALYGCCQGGAGPQSTHRGRVEIGGVYLPSQLERTSQLCTWW